MLRIQERIKIRAGCIVSDCLLE